MNPLFIVLYFFVILYGFKVAADSHQKARDLFEVHEIGYGGYIMPLVGTESKYDPLNVYSRPSQSTVRLSEKMLASYLDIFCRLNKGWQDLHLNSADSVHYHLLFTSYFEGYYRQYAAYTPKNGGHKFISICLVSPDFQNRVKDKPDYLKNHWAEADEGGPILFHADIDLITGDVFLRDNGDS